VVDGWIDEDVCYICAHTYARAVERARAHTHMNVLCKFIPTMISGSLEMS